MNRQYYKQGGPAFFLFSGECELSDGFLQTCNFQTNLISNSFFYLAKGKYLNDMMTNAKRHNAMVFSMEHRYYGKSVPVA